MQNPIQIKTDIDGVKTVYYFGKETGWITKSKLSRTGHLIYKTLSVRGTISHCETVQSAKNWLIGEYH